MVFLVPKPASVNESWPHAQPKNGYAYKVWRGGILGKKQIKPSKGERGDVEEGGEGRDSSTRDKNQKTQKDTKTLKWEVSK